MGFIHDTYFNRLAKLSNLIVGSECVVFYRSILKFCVLYYISGFYLVGEWRNGHCPPSPSKKEFYCHPKTSKINQLAIPLTTNSEKSGNNSTGNKS